MEVTFIAVAHPEHPLHRLNRELTAEDLVDHLQIVVRDSGSRARDDGWLGATQRWTVTSAETKVSLMSAGLGFGWLPTHLIGDELRAGLLKPLPLREGRERRRTLYLVFANPQSAAPVRGASPKSSALSRAGPSTRADR
jgi:DNA-binding transcriptional LysR family regulator